MLESILATWKAGGAYIPFDPDNPAERTLEILKDSGSPLLLTQREYLDPKIEDSYHGQVIKLDKEIERIREERKSSPEVPVDMNNLAYVIYTSGSTGKPKGAMVEHIGMINHIQAKIHDLQLAGDSTVAQNASHTFDISVWQFFAALTAGGKTVIYPYDLILESGRFISRIVEDQVTILEVVPSYLSIMLDAIAMQYPMSLPVKYLLVTGEEVKPHLVKRWFQMFPDIKMVNAYGPTEASDDITHYIMEKAPDRERIPIGNPLQNLNIYIVDEHMNPCPIGIKGEILVSGIGVGRGYLNDEERTKQVFGEDPFAKEKGVRIYRTGDLGCWLEDGTIEFFGRKDHQVKIRGFRIELGEIENHLTRYAGVKEAVVVDREDKQGSKYLCAYMVTIGNVETKKLKSHLSNRLPQYMVPEFFVKLPEMPLTPNGKIDRKQLPEPFLDNQSLMTYVTEEMLKQVAVKWERNPGKKNSCEEETHEEYILSKEEKEEILYIFNNTKTEFPRDQLINELVETQVDITPDKIAAAFEDKQITYGHLNKKANQLAQVLRAKGTSMESIVGLMVTRSIEMIIGMLAVLKAGGAYLPLGLENPKERINHILKDCNAQLLLVDFNEPLTSYPSALININDTLNYKGDTLNLPAIASPANLAYVIYTSGTTGTPKGVMIEHRSVVNFRKGMTDLIHFKPGDRILSLITLSFDIFVLETLIPLTKGVLVVIGNAEEQTNIQATVSVMERKDITIFQATPSIVQLLVSNNESWRSLSPLRYLLIGGEIFPEKLLAKLTEFIKGKIYNLYGPTETTVWSTVKDVTGEKTINIGKPIANTRVYILWKTGMLQPVGVAGELCIGGEGVARGYLGKVQLTAERFMIDPFVKKERIYRTGDIARWLSDGNLEFIGRKDHQVKIKGFRIELGELENILLNHKDIKEVAVVVREDPGGDKYLCACIVAEKPLSEFEVRENLSRQLPIYMIPSYFVQLEKMPLIPNGKLNRKVLEVMDLKRNVHTDYEAPRNEKEKLLSEIWSEILEVENVGINHNFFQLGGHSLKAVYIISRVNKELLTSLPVSIIFEKPTIAELMESLTEKKDEKLLKIEKCPENEYYQLSHAQKRLWFFDQMDPGNPAYNLPQAVRFIGDLDIGAVEQTMVILMKRHEALRTSINVVEVEEKSDETRMEELPLQIVHDQVEIKLNRRDISNLPQKEREKILHQLLEEEGLKPFDLTQAPLFRITLVTMGPLEQVMIFVMHHIVSDGWSMRVIVEEFGYFYDQLKRNSAINYQPLQFQYKDFAYWQNQLLSQNRLQDQQLYWHERLSGELPVLNLATDYPRPPLQSFNADKINFDIDVSLTGKLKALAKREISTIFMILTAAFKVLLYRYTQQEDNLIGTLIAGRSSHEMEKVIGYFVNILVLRDTIKGEWKFIDFLKKVRQNMLDAYDNQDYPFDKLVDELRVERNAGRSPVFDIMLAFQNYQEVDLESSLKSLKIEAIEKDYVVSKYDLYFDIIEMPDHVAIQLEFCSDLYKKETINRMVNHYLNILNSITRHPEKPIPQIDMLSEAEKKKLLVDFNDNREEIPGDKCYHHLFQEQAAKTPERTAAKRNGKPVTYRELNQQANRICRFLVAHGVKTGMMVALFMQRSIHMLASIIGVFKAGGAYLPIEMEYPANRIRFMLQDAEVGIVIVEREDQQRLEAIAGDSLHIPQSLCVDDADVLGTYPDTNLDDNPCCLSTPQDYAYMIYTSGTTGQPKGVLIHQLGMINHLYAKKHDLSITANDRVAQTASCCFDISVWQFLAALLVGGQTVIFDYETVLNPEALLVELQQEKITIFETVPSLLTLFLEMLESSNNKALTDLRWVIPTGEALSPSLVEKWFNHYPGIKMVNAYGPTEASDDITHYVITESADVGELSVPIGKPVQNLRIYILDRHLSLCPIGVRGEICVAGPGVGKGYWKDPRKTEQAFIPNPYALDDSEFETLYKTGDLGYFQDDGNIQCLGRIDNQVKVRGFRVELEEIEAVMLQHETVSECAVIVIKKDQEDSLVAFLVEKEKTNVEAFKKFLLDYLPPYMIPSTFVILEEMPLSLSGKTDRKALASMDIQLAAKNTRLQFAAPTSTTEKKIAQVWSNTLKTDTIGIHDNFFDLGGHSLLIPRMFRKLDTLFPAKIVMADLFEYVTIHELARYIDDTGTGQEDAEEDVIMELSID
jgi:amino acid adenylation domain-containing protein